MPGTGLPREDVEAALKDLLSWPELARSPQLAKFLQYIVNRRLDGDAAGIKAYAIAVDVFGRPADFDPQLDPIVRVQARRLRGLLADYYSGPGAGSPVEIYLPVGRYVPEFTQRGAQAAQAAAAAADPVADPAAVITPLYQGPARTSRAGRVVLFAALAAMSLGIVVVLALLLQARPSMIGVPRPPSIAVAEFTGLADSGVPPPDVAGLAVELVTDLELFEDIGVVYALAPQSVLTERSDEFVLAGIARLENGRVLVTATLRLAGTDAAVWTHTLESGLSVDIDGVSQSFAERLGSHNGPLFASVNAWLDANPVIAGGESAFICGMLFSRYRNTGATADAARARDCLSALLRREPRSATGLALSGGLLIDTILATQPPGEIDPSPIAEAQGMIEQAVALAPTSSLVWEQRGRLLELLGRSKEALGAYISARQLNPANLDAVAAAARAAVLAGPSPASEALALSVLGRAQNPPPWYFAAPAVAALRDGDDAAALRYAERLEPSDAELAALVGTTAARRSGDQSQLNRYVAQLYDIARFRRFGILPVLRQRIADSALVAQIAAELAAAGLSQDALGQQF